ncbi:MAG: hypothetical protein AUI14_16320 [Actinobacteria bacterium 13_2_20CM_2_71_6]|nr:MAG: hypothetical protein AUI14_16320 [Actinobacteria bacterium 13_2_20CM_2_71_6]
MTAAQPPGRAHARPVALALLFWFGLVLSVAPWWYGTIGGVTDASSALIAAGRITGLIGGYVLLVQITLISRIPPFERWMGGNALAWHRDLGIVVVVVTLAHVVLTICGYAVLDRTPVAAEAWSVLTGYEAMISALVATAVLVVVVLTATRVVRARVSYERWYRLHLMGYLVLLLGYGHQFATGRELERAGFARAYWGVLYVTALACLAWGRIVRPLRTNLRHRLRVDRVVDETPDTVSVYVVGRRLADLEAKAGQFFRWRFLARGMWWQSHPFSLSAAPNEDWLRVTVKVVGDHTEDLCEMLRPGVPVLVSGPSGDFTADRRIRFRALLIAGGTGIAPIRALLEELPARTVVIYRASRWQDLVFRAELDWLALARDATVIYAVGSRDDPGPSRVLSPAGLREAVPDIGRRDVYVCGPGSLVSATHRALRHLKVPRRQIHLDPFEF